MKSNVTRQLAAAILVLAWWASAGPAESGTMLRNICRVKGQEENTLHAMGLVVGLKGTGDGGDFLPTIRSLGMAMKFMGNPTGLDGSAELKATKNVALVLVTARIPATGARQGDKIDCLVNSIGTAKSLTGGYLFMTPMLGPVPETDARVYALAEGLVTIDDDDMPTMGRLHRGCRLEEDFMYNYTKEGKITLVLDRDYADFQVAQEVVEAINGSELVFENNNTPIARAIDAVNIEVDIPRQYVAQPGVAEPVLFVAQLLRIEVLDLPTAAQVVVNERAGSIVIGGDVEIGPVAVTHKNIVVETGTTVAGNQFVPVDVAADAAEPENPKLKALVEALNAVNVPTEDIIEIIKRVERNGKLYGRLIIE